MKHPHSTLLPGSTRYVRQNLFLDLGGAAGSSANPRQMNRNPANVSALTADGVLGHPTGEFWLTRDSQPMPKAKVRIIEGEGARRLGHEEKWDLLSPFLKQHGREGIAYATLPGAPT